MTLDEQIAVMQAFNEGKEIEYAHRGVGKYLPCLEPLWNWAAFDYRVKPQKIK